MPTPTKGPRLGGSPAHQRHILANLATALFEHGRIRTTEAKARRLQPVAERLITFAKRGDLHARRQVLTVVTDKSILHTLFTEEAAVGGEAERAAEPIDPDDAVRDDAEATDVGPAEQTADAEADEASAHATPEPEDGEHV